MKDFWSYGRAPALLVAAALAGCGDDAVGPAPVVEVVGLEYGGGLFDQTIGYDGIPRSYTVAVPSIATPGSPAPLVLVFHDTDQSVTDMRTLTAFDVAAGERGWIVAYLATDQGSWALSRRVAPGSSGLDDVGFASHVVDRIGADLSLDLDRVYAAGFGEGGLMAQAWTCVRSDQVAAVAAVGTSASLEVASDCVFQRAVSGMILAGTEDPVHRFNGGSPEGTYGLLTAPGAALWWADAQGCGPIIEITALPDLADDGTRVERLRYPICTRAAEVRLYSVLGGGHAWPGSSAAQPSALGLKSLDVDATAVVLEFFADNPRRVLTSGL